MQSDAMSLHCYMCAHTLTRARAHARTRSQLQNDLNLTGPRDHIAIHKNRMDAPTKLFTLS